MQVTGNFVSDRDSSSRKAQNDELRSVEMFKFRCETLSSVDSIFEVHVARG